MKHSQGTGLGLNICQALCQSLGAKFEIQSQKNQVTAHIIFGSRT